MLYFVTPEGKEYKKDISGKKHWWYVNHDGSWYPISGEPTQKLVPK